MAGTIVGTIQATDEDSGEFGTDGIRYSLLQGSVGDMLQIDPVSGVLSVSRASGVLDREKVTELIVMVEARDALGKGNR